jgi:hypothetical protein
MKYSWTLILLTTIFGLATIGGCNNRHERSEQNIDKSKSNEDQDIEEVKIGKVVFLLENSGSLMGYVNGDTDFKTSLVALATLPEFDNIVKSFNFINGKDNVLVQDVGNTADELENVLKPKNFNSSYSNLTKMFEVALDSAYKSNISILVTDGLYDVGESENSIKALELEVEKTQEVFRNKLKVEGVETIIIKSYSNFKGRYYFASKAGSKLIDQQRPYYIFIFGNSKLLNKLRVDNFRDKIKGFANMARFQAIGTAKIPYQITSKNLLGDFKFDKDHLNILNDVEPDRHSQGFQFSFAVDYESLPYSNTYIQTLSNYTCSENYSLLSVKEVTKKLYEVTSFSPTQLITVSSIAIPYGKLEVSLKSVAPEWITNTNTDNETYILTDTTQTFGFKFLTNAISEAYSYKNKEKNIANFTFELNK